MLGRFIGGCSSRNKCGDIEEKQLRNVNNNKINLRIFVAKQIEV